MDVTRKEYLLERIADELRPYKAGRRISIDWLRTRCERMAEEYRSWIDGLAKFGERSGPPVKKRLLTLERKAEAFAIALRTAPEAVAGLPIIFGTGAEKKSMLCEVGRIAASAKDAAGKVHMRKARSILPKTICADHALELMLEFSNRKVASTPNVGFVMLSSLLYELFTGIQNKRFDSACIATFHSEQQAWQYLSGWQEVTRASLSPRKAPRPQRLKKAAAKDGAAHGVHTRQKVKHMGGER